MKVEFEFSTADLAEVASRSVNRSPLVHRWRRQNTVGAAVVLGLLGFAFTPGTTAIRLVSGCLFFCIPLLMALGPQHLARKRTQAFYRERLGSEGPFTCEVEITPAGVLSRQLGQELVHPWAHVASVSEVPEGIEFLFRPIGSLLVRSRAFPDLEARRQFLKMAQGLMLEGSPPSTSEVER
jgi:hypothetical protein